MSIQKLVKDKSDREIARMLCIELGVPEASRRTGIPEGTLYSWSSRYRWDLPKRAGRPARELQGKGGDILHAAHAELGGRTRTALAQATAKAAEATAKAEKPIEVSSPAHLRDLAASAARIFGWDEAQPHNQYNTLVISPEELQRIRDAREPVAGDVQAPQSSPKAGARPMSWDRNW
jgi:hypothetical protein